MGYKINIAINCEKAVDWTQLEGVTLLVYHEGESYSILTLISNASGYAFGSVDRAHWINAEVKRIKVYASKSGYAQAIVKANLEGSFVDASDVTNYSFSVTVLLDTVEPEVLPPPTVVPITP